MDLFKYLPIAFAAMQRKDRMLAVWVVWEPVVQAALAAWQRTKGEIQALQAELFPQLQGSLAASGALTTAFSICWLQESLNKLGAAPPIKIDNDYGAATKKAVSMFQQANGITVDGWAGLETILAIGVALATLAKPALPPTQRP